MTQDDYEIILYREFDDDKQRMNAAEVIAAAKKMKAEVIDANHYINPKVVIPSKYLPCFVKDSDGSLWRDDDIVDGQNVFANWRPSDRYGVVLMRKKKVKP